jgi:hypothetical protein
MGRRRMDSFPVRKRRKTSYPGEYIRSNALGSNTLAGVRGQSKKDSLQSRIALGMGYVSRDALPAVLGSGPIGIKIYLSWKIGTILYNNRDTVKVAIPCILHGRCNDFTENIKKKFEGDVEDYASMTGEKVVEQILKSNGFDPDVVGDILPTLQNPKTRERLLRVRERFRQDKHPSLSNSHHSGSAGFPQGRGLRQL